MRAGQQRRPGIREPAGARQAAPRPPRDDGRPALRLTLARGQLGIELDAPFALGPIEVVDFAVSLPDVRFPIDLSGGVARFRHRRGRVERVGIEAKAPAVAAWAARRLAGIVEDERRADKAIAIVPDVVVAPFDGGALIGLRAGRAALAFDVLVAPIEGDLRLIPERARALGAAGVPHTLALRALSALCGSMGELVDGAIVVRRAAARVGRELFPAAGARAPTDAGVVMQGLGAQLLRFSIEGAAGERSDAPALSPRTLRALEVCELAGEADAKALAGDVEAARDGLLTALERAPRHPEITARLAWIDHAAFDRVEGALATLGEATPVMFAGLIGAELLRAVGDLDGAREAYGRAAHEEPFGALAALGWMRAADVCGEIDDRLRALDEAVARAPGLDEARWARFTARLDVADVRGARADADHLEAAARGGPLRHAVWLRAAEAFLARGLVAESSGLFERALRYVPDDAAAIAGLARAFRAAGQHRRAVDLFARASALAERAGRRVYAVEVELARALAEVAEDRPAAIARLRAVPIDVPERFEARLLEARYRVELGDVAGGAIAIGRLRDAVELSIENMGDQAARVAALLVEAADLDDQAGDAVAAQRDLGLALRLRPRDRAIQARFREVAGRVAARAPAAQPPPAFALEQDRDGRGHDEAARDREGEREGETFATSDDGFGSAETEHRIESLTQRLRADPRDAATALALAEILDGLGRDLDLLALASARFDEGDDDERARVAPFRARALGRLAAIARAEGRIGEAQLYEDLLRGI